MSKFSHCYCCYCCPPGLRSLTATWERKLRGNSKIWTKIQGRFFGYHLDSWLKVGSNFQLTCETFNLHWRWFDMLSCLGDFDVDLLSGRKSSDQSRFWLFKVDKRCGNFPKCDKRCQILLVDGDTDFPVGLGTSLIELQQVTASTWQPPLPELIWLHSSQKWLLSVLLHSAQLKRETTSCAWLLSRRILEHHAVTASELNHDQWT